MTNYAIALVRYLTTALLASLTFSAVWTAFGASLPFVGVSLVRTIADFTDNAPFFNLSFVLIGLWFHNTDRAPYAICRALVEFGGQLGVIYRAVLVSLTCGFVVILCLISLR